MKCKPYSEITVEIRTQLKTVKITSNIFAVWAKPDELEHFEHFYKPFTIFSSSLLLCKF